MAMTEEQKKAAAEKRKATLAAKKAQQEAQAQAQQEQKADNGELDMLRQQNEMLMKQMEELQARMASMIQPQKPQIIQVQQPKDLVHFIWQAPVADDNTIDFGDGGMYGRIIGKTGSFFVPKADLSRILSEMNRYFLEQRWLIVVDGLTDEEREALGVDYKEGELLDRKAFAKMVDLGDELLDIYPKLCDGHKKMVAKRYYEAWKEGNKNVTRDRVVALNKMSKEAGSKDGDFVDIIEEMNEKDAR